LTPIYDVVYWSKTDFESSGEEKEPLRNRERLVWMKSFVPANPILVEVELTGFQVTNFIVVMSCCIFASRSPKPAFIFAYVL
jgi:hypothetical protein